MTVATLSGTHLLNASIAPAPILLIPAIVAIGGATYVATHALLWLAVGKPVGPEREFLELLNAFKRRIGALSAP